MIKKIFRFFDKLEDEVRGRMSHFPILYAIFGGVLMITFWRGVWHTGDILMAKGGWLGVIFYEPITLLWTTALMLLCGLFVSFFIGDHILISGLKHGQKITDKTEKEIEEEEARIDRIDNKIKKMEADIEEIKNLLKK